MREGDKVFCDRALAYLKAEAPGDDLAVKLTLLDEPILRPLGNGLLAAYVVDVGTALELVQRRQLSGAGLTEDELHERAVTTLLDLADERLEIRAYKGAFVALMGGNFEASLLLVNRLWVEDLAHLAPNGFVAAVPARDVLAFCDAASLTGITELRAIVARVQAGNMEHLLTSVLLCRQSKSWIRHVN